MLMLSGETRRTISLHHADVSGEKNPMYGRRHSKRTRAKIAAKAALRIGARNGRWRGGSFIHNGYRLLLKPDHPFADKAGYVREHRLVIEEHLGRYLLREEIVHHKDGNKLNNTLSNLEVTTFGRHNIIHPRHIGRERDKKGRWVVERL